MQFAGAIHTFPKNVKIFIVFFLIALSFGFISGFSFLDKTTHLNSEGIEENYNGNEEDENADIMIFKKSEGEILVIIHSHVLSMSLIFLALGGLLITTSVNQTVKTFLLIEPFVSILLTFGGIWIMWKEVFWFKYIVMFSGILLTVSFVLMVFLILWQLVAVKGKKNRLTTTF